MRKSTLTEALKNAITLQQAAHHFHPIPHKNAVERWCRVGVRGVKLESWLSAGRRVTTPAAIERFLLALNRAAEPIDDDGERRAAEAGKALEALGA